jgi:tRNA(Ile)-lysidine synthase
MSGRSHPPALLRRTLRTLHEETSLRAGDRIVVAVSGGGDSTALLHVLARLAAELGVVLHAHGVDHGLRPAARDELALAAHLAASLGVAFSHSTLSLAAGGNLQARARAARYAELDRVADQIGARWVATGHHANDRAETVLLRILRGTSPRGLAVLPAASERRLRPFIRSPKSAILQHLERHALQHAHDPSNEHPRFLRTRVRRELLPLLEQLTPGAARHLNLLADEWALPPLVVTDEQGQTLHLKSNQAAQIRRAQKLGQPDARIWLSGGRELIVSASCAQGSESAPAGASNCAEPRKKPRCGGENRVARGADRPKSD